MDLPKIDRQSGQRTLYTVLAQGLSSVTNFLVNGLALVTLGVTAFGNFSIVYQLCLVIVAVAQGSIGSAALVYASRSATDEESSDLVGGIALSALLLGGVCGLLAASVATILPSEMRSLVLIAAVGMPAISAQYVMRELRFAEGRVRSVVAADAVWLGVIIIAALLDLILGGDRSADYYLAFWLFGGAISATPLLVVAAKSSIGSARRFIQLAGAQAFQFGVDSVLARGTFVVTLAVASYFSGPRTSGTIAAAALLFTPLSVVNSTVTAVVVPPLVKKEGVHFAGPRVPALAAAAVVFITVGWAGTVAVSNQLGIALGPFDLNHGDVTTALFLATLLRFVAMAVWRGAFVGLRIADAATENLSVRMQATLAQLALPVIGLWLYGPVGCVLGLAAGTWVGALLAWQSYLKLGSI